MEQGKKTTKKQMPVYIRAAILFLVVVVVGIGLCMLFTPAFHVAEVSCEGNQRISQEEIIAIAEVPLGQSIFLQRLSGIRERVAQIPMVEEAKVRRVFPNKIKITIQERVPAAYLYDGDSSCVVVDIEGKILEILEGEPVAKMRAFYAPVKKEEPEKKDSEKTRTQDKKDPDAEETAAEESKPEEAENNEASENQEEKNAESAPEESQETKKITEPKRAYPIPFVEGLKPHKPEAGKMLDSKERDKLSKVQETFRALEEADLLVRTTYMDVTDINDVFLIIENRLEVFMGEIQNIDYRCQFLATVIKEKISATEHVIMDYRGNDIYVRQPEDGKDWMVPKPKEDSESSENSEDAPEDETEQNEEESSEESGAEPTENPAEEE